MPPVHDTATVERLQRLVELALDAHYRGGDPAPLVAQFDAETGQSYDIEDFDVAYRTMDLRDMVNIALDRQPAGVVATDDELEAIIGHVAGGGASDREIHYWLTFLDRQLPHPEITDLVFHANLDSPAAILAEARSYQPMPLR
jgi:hypothetical protein